jgi:hypothetical protein
MMKTTKARAESLVSDLHKSVAPEAQAVIELVGLLFEEAKNKLVRSEGDELLRLQGEARAFERLRSQLTRQPLSRE